MARTAPFVYLPGMTNAAHPPCRTALAALVAAMLLAVSALQACRAQELERPWTAWPKTLPLIGKVIRSGGSVAAGLDQEAEALVAIEADFLLVGEVHDNAEHHKLQAWILQERSRKGRKTALVMEHIRSDQQARLDKLLAPGASASATDVLDALHWEKTNWPDKDMFAPIFSAALAARVPIRAGDPAREQIRATARGGVAALAEGERARLGLERSLEPPLQAALVDELSQSHCGLMPKQAFTGLADAQRYRDAHLARAMADAAQQASSMLLAGNGHVRSDRGVPWHLRQFASGSRIVSIALVEVQEGETSVQSYVPRAPDGAAAADIVILTPRTEREDPCVQMRKQFGR